MVIRADPRPAVPAADEGLARYLDPVARVLLLLLDDSPAADARLADLLAAPDFNWIALVQLAEIERATPVLRRRLQRLEGISVPTERLGQLSALARVAAFRMGYLEERLLESLDVLDAAGIRVVLLKGAALAATVYSGIADRPMADVDLLVAVSDGRRAWELLRKAGWTTAASDRRRYESHHHLPPLEDPAGTGLALEIHTALAHGSGTTTLHADAILAAAGPARLGGREVHTPAPHHLVVHLGVHFAWSHGLGWGAWRTFRDLHAIVRGLPVDWTAVVEDARTSHSATSVYWTLRLARDLTPFEPPPGVLDELRPPRPEAVLRLLDRHFTSSLFATGMAACPSTTVSRGLWSLGMAPRWSGHGAERPWLHDAEWLADGNGTASASRLDRLRHQLGELRSWSRWVLTLLGIAGGGRLQASGR